MGEAEVALPQEGGRQLVCHLRHQEDLGWSWTEVCVWGRTGLSYATKQNEKFTVPPHLESGSLTVFLGVCSDVNAASSSILYTPTLAREAPHSPKKRKALLPAEQQTRKAGKSEAQAGGGGEHSTTQQGYCWDSDSPRIRTDQTNRTNHLQGEQMQFPLETYQFVTC